MKILLDAFGGDNAPEEVVKAATEYVRGGGKADICLVGKQEVINKLLDDCGFEKSPAITVMNATEVITCEESPTEAFKKKPDSTISVAMNALKTGEYGAFVSAGSTGALLTAAVLKAGRIKGVSRPALATMMPTVTGECLFLDCGANADCKPINLVHFAVMADVYMKKVKKVENARIGLLCNGTEDKKGSELTHAVFAALKQIPSLNFIGNVEGRDILSGACDIVVTDGFSGNVALKSIEGAVNIMLHFLKRNIKESASAKFGYLFMKKAFKKTMKTLDYNSRGGAVFLGVNGVIAKSHGSSRSKSFVGTLYQAECALENDINAEIEARINSDEIKGIKFE